MFNTKKGTAAAFYALWLLAWIVVLIVVPWSTGFATPKSRVWAFAITVLGAIFLFMALGMSIAERPFGVLQSGRNAYSLSRLQMALWTVLILSALVSVAVCRAWHLGPSEALAIGIPTDLLTVMGISYVTGAAAPALLALKAQASEPAADRVTFAARRAGEPLRSVGTVVYRPNSAAPKLADLVQGDDLATAGTVDLSKVQQLLITLLVVGIYGAMLAQLLHGADFFDMVITQGLDETPSAGRGTQLPPFTKNFVNLLLLSHAGYLVYKAAPRPAPAPVRASPPDREPTPAIR